MELAARPASRWPPVVLVATWAVTAMAWWAVAFWPADDAAAAWLTQARYVCFGARPGGLPDAWGWMVLFVGPGLLLAAVVVTWGDELRTTFAQLGRAAGARALMLLVATAFVAELGWVAYRVRAVDAQARFDPNPAVEGPLPEGYLRTEKALPPFNLTDQRGEKVGWATFGGQPVIVAFVFAHCANVCSMLLKDTLAAARELDPARTAILFVTLDPWRDTVASLPGLAERWGLPANARLVSGPPAEVTALTDAFGVPWQRDPNTGDITHPALVFVVDGHGQLAYALNAPPQGWLAQAVRRVQ